MAMHYLVRVLMVLAFLLAMADVVSTVKALALGAREANPLMAFFMRVFESKWMLVRLVMALGTTWIVMRDPAYAETWRGALFFAVNVALLLFVVWNNWKVARQLAR